MGCTPAKNGRATNLVDDDLWLKQKCQRRLAAILNLEREQIICTGATEIYGGNGNALLRRHLKLGR